MVAKWSLTRTVLIVGEGYAEVAFLQHVKRLLNKRGDGLAARPGQRCGEARVCLRARSGVQRNGPWVLSRALPRRKRFSR